MQFTIYRSTDTSAPALTGSAGSLITLLQAILVNGYGSQSAAGWTQPFTASGNVCVFQSGSGTKRYLRVQDDGSLTGGARDTIIRGYESMTALSTGLNPFPTVAQLASGVNWRKSLTADTTARAWVAIADSRTLYLLVQTGDTDATSGYYPLYMFGDFYSYTPGDLYNCMVIGAVGTSSTTATFGQGNTSYWSGDQLSNSMTQTNVGCGHYVDRTSSGSSSSQPTVKKGVGGLNQNGISDQNYNYGFLAFPNTSDGCIYINPYWIMDVMSPDSVHGELRGLWVQNHAISNWADQDTFSGLPTGNISGRSFIVFKETPNLGVWVFETSNTVNSN